MVSTAGTTTCTIKGPAGVCHHSHSGQCLWDVCFVKHLRIAVAAYNGADGEWKGWFTQCIVASTLHSFCSPVATLLFLSSPNYHSTCLLVYFGPVVPKLCVERCPWSFPSIGSSRWCNLGSHNISQYSTSTILDLEFLWDPRWRCMAPLGRRRMCVPKKICVYLVWTCITALKLISRLKIYVLCSQIINRATILPTD